MNDDCRSARPPVGVDIAVRGIDNWDGEGDTYLRIAYLDEDGIVRERENDKELLQYVGDEILEWWPLTRGAGTPLVAGQTISPPDPEGFVVRVIEEPFDESDDNVEYLATAWVFSDGAIWSRESGRPFLERPGDQILEWWPVAPGTGMKLPNDAELDETDSMIKRPRVRA